jgi:hypothetical protein
MSTFTDANGREWCLDIKFKHVEEVKRYCKGQDGKPIDLLAILATGNLEQLLNDVVTMVNITGVVCYEQTREHFNLAAYDEAHKDDYEMEPELKAETGRIKASRWFGEQLDGPALEALIDAFLEALVNFCPNGSRKAALKKILAKSKEVEQIQSETMLQQIDEAAVQIQAETKRRIQESVSGVLSGSVPGSPELPLVHSASGS